MIGLCINGKILRNGKLHIPSVRNQKLVTGRRYGCNIVNGVVCVLDKEYQPDWKTLVRPNDKKITESYIKKKRMDKALKKHAPEILETLKECINEIENKLGGWFTIKLEDKVKSIIKKCNHG
jgi:hypothetical protein